MCQCRQRETATEIRSQRRSCLLSTNPTRWHIDSDLRDRPLDNGWARLGDPFVWVLHASAATPPPWECARHRMKSCSCCHYWRGWEYCLLKDFPSLSCSLQALDTHRSELLLTAKYKDERRIVAHHFLHCCCCVRNSFGSPVLFKVNIFRKGVQIYDY